MVKVSIRGEDVVLYSLFLLLVVRFFLIFRLVYGKIFNIDFFSLIERFCESDIQKVQKVLCDVKRVGMNFIGIDIVGKGQFFESVFCILKCFCILVDIICKVFLEVNWFFKMKCLFEDFVRL